MNVKKYDVRVRESRIPYLVTVGRTGISDEETHQSPQRMVDIVRQVYHADQLPEEHIFLLAFDVKLHLIGLFELGHGTYQESSVNPAQIIQRVLLCGACVFSIIHNHPSGDVRPSEADIKLTERVAMAAKVCGVDMCDHIIVAGAHKKAYFSFRESTGILN